MPVPAQPVARLNLPRLVARVNAATGAALQLDGASEHGESGGAGFVHWPDGRDAVLTVSPLELVAAQHAAHVLLGVKTAGLPVPRHDLIVPLDGGSVAVVQERLFGEPATWVDEKVVDAMVAMNDRFADLLVGRPDVPAASSYLRHSAPAISGHEALNAYSSRARRVLRHIREVGSDEQELTGEDLVHLDYTSGNVLFDPAGEVSGVVDWNFGVARGDRHFALVKTRLDLSWCLLDPTVDKHHVQVEAVERLDEILHARVPAEVLQRYWACWTLYQLPWAISFEKAEVVDMFLSLAEEHLHIG